MLTVSRDAATLVRTLREGADLPHGAGLRIVIDPDHQSLSMGLVRSPEPHDEVVTSGDARIFLSRPAAARLQRRTLRAEITGKRSSFFLDG